MIKGKVKPLTKPAKGESYSLSKEQQDWLLANKDENKTAIAEALGITRQGVYKLLKRLDPNGKPKETKRQRIIRKTAEQLAPQIEKAEKKEKQRIIKAAAKDIIKNRTLMDRMNEVVKGKDGQPLQYNGEALTTEAMMDISLINQAKESPQANISLRAQVMALQLEEERQREQKDRKAMLTRLQKQKEKRTGQMQQSLRDKGIFTDMTHTMLETWGNAWELMKIAEWNWKRRGGETIEVQITAQAQRIERPNQLYETYRNALKAYNEADQKLRAAVAAYFKLVNGDNDEGANEGDAIGAEIMKILNSPT